MLGMKLVRLVERHCDELSRGLTEQIRTAERTSDFRKITPTELQRAIAEVFRNLGEWLLQKTEADVASRFTAIAARRASEGIGLQQLVWALMLTRDYLWHFLRQEAFADSIVELHGELEVDQMLNQFFDRAVYYAILGYDGADRQRAPKSDWARAQEVAVSIGLLPHPKHAP